MPKTVTPAFPYERLVRLFHEVTDMNVPLDPRLPFTLRSSADESCWTEIRPDLMDLT